MARDCTVIFIAGIDTGIGKTVACGMLARALLDRGRSVITQKLVQTGCRGLSSDIRAHRRAMGVALTPEDRSGLTCPYVFRFPASPHLAAAREGARISLSRISSATRRLARLYDHVLVEGVGGIEVPLRDGVTTLDYLARHRYPVILVSSSRLGSINHTLLTLRALHGRGLRVLGIIYNRRPRDNGTMARDTRRVLAVALRRLGYPGVVVDLPRAGGTAGAGRAFASRCTRLFGAQ
jgi:dethiobiotin synthetase